MADWHDRANCLGINTELFYPVGGDDELAAAAKAICCRCEVRAECLGYALARGERFGVWGGMSERERRGLLRARRTGDVGAA